MRLLHQSFNAVMADLMDRAAMSSFHRDFPPTGSFLHRKIKGRDYVYYSGYVAGRKCSRYVGRASDENVQRLVFQMPSWKEDYEARRHLVKTALSFGVRRPDRSGAEIVSQLERAGLFRLDGVLVGTMAYQTYGPLLGVLLPGEASARTDDVDFAQFHSVSISVEDTTTDILEALQRVDPSFTGVPSLDPKALPARFKNADGFLVEFLTPNRGSDAHQGRVTPMPSLSGAGAIPLRFLDFLIHDAEQTVLLFREGAPVRVPAPERYAVHKMIVSERRRAGTSASKASKDLRQAEALIEALQLSRRDLELGEVWGEAWGRGRAWREALNRSRARLGATAAEALAQSIQKAESVHEGANRRLRSR